MLPLISDLPSERLVLLAPYPDMFSADAELEWFRWQRSFGTLNLRAEPEASEEFSEFWPSVLLGEGLLLKASRNPLGCSKDSSMVSWGLLDFFLSLLKVKRLFTLWFCEVGSSSPR